MKTKMAFAIALCLMVSVIGRSQPIQLPDGCKLSFLGLTRGQRHMAPGYENLATGNPIFTPNGGTVAWIKAEHDPSRWPSFELLISDRANTGCVSIEKGSSSHVRAGVDVLGFVLNAFPRWDREMILRVRPIYGAIAPGQFVASNSTQVALGDWKPEPLPITKSDGDFQVTLANVVAGVPLPYRQGEPAPASDPANQCVRLAFDFQQNGLTATNWRPRLVQTTDLFGNRVQGVISEYPRGGIYDYSTGNARKRDTDGYFYRPGLWLNETAWKVRLEFSRISGFSDDEILTFANLPVRLGTEEDADNEWGMDASKTDSNLMPATVNGIQIKLLAPLQFPSRLQEGKKFIRVLIFADPNPILQGMHLKVLEVTDDRGREVSASPPPWAGHFSIDIPTVGDIKSLNLKLALHNSRFVEFTVKPAKL